MKKILLLLFSIYFISCTHNIVPPSPYIPQDSVPSIVQGPKGDKGDKGDPGKDAPIPTGDINQQFPQIQTINQDGTIKVVPYFPTIVEVTDRSYIDSTEKILQVEIDAYRAAKAEKYHRHNISDIDGLNISIIPIDLTPNSLRSFGAIPNDGIDDYPGFQAAIDYYSTHNLSIIKPESGEYLFSQAIKLGNGTDFVFLSIIGDGNAFNPYAKGAGGTVFHSLNKNSSCIEIQGGKGLTIANINGVGQNTGLETFSYDDVVNEKDNFNSNNCLDTRTACHAFITIDPSKDGKASTGIRVTDCYARYFIAGIVISPQGSQNGEDCKFTNIWFQDMKICFSSGNPQNRTNTITNFTNWGHTLYSFSTDSYGGTGCPFIIHGYNAAGGNKYIFRTGNWYGNEENLYDAHVEEMYAGGGFFNGRGRNINIYDAHIYFMGSSISQIPSQLFQCNSIHAINSHFFFSYGKQPCMMALSVNHAIFDNCSLDNPIILAGGGGRDLRYINCFVGRANNVDSDYIKSVVTVASLVTIGANSWSFISGDSKIQVGQFVAIWKSNIKSEFSFENPISQPAGTIQSINGNVITCTGYPYGIVTGQPLDITMYQ